MNQKKRANVLEEKLQLNCTLGKVDQVKEILQGGNVNVNKPVNNFSRDNPLILACRNPSHEIVKMLLNQYGIDLNFENKYGKTAFYYACESGRDDIVKEFLKDKRIFENLNKHTHDYNSNTPLIVASREGHVEVVKLLLETKKVIINEKNNFGQTAFFTACDNGQVGVVKELMNRLNEKTINPESVKTFQSIVNTKLSKRFQKNNLDVNRADKNGNTGFMMSCEKGYLSILELLLKDPRTSLNLRNTTGKTGFYFGCENKKIEIVERLLEDERVDINQGDKYGNTGLIFSCFNSCPQIVKLLLDSPRIKTNITNVSGKTAFIYACEFNNLEALKLLLNDKRVNINKPTREGMTGLMIASQRGYFQTMKLILASRKDIDLTLKTKNGKTLLDVARQRNHPEIVKLLENYNRDPEAVQLELRRQLCFRGNYLFYNLFVRQSKEKNIL